MPLYEGFIIIKESVVHWRFAASDIEEARVRVCEQVEREISDNVKSGCIEVKK